MEEPVQDAGVIVEPAKKGPQEGRVAGFVIAIDRVRDQVGELYETRGLTVDKQGHFNEVSQASETRP